jgi:Tfp pilus assembly protein PilP
MAKPAVKTAAGRKNAPVKVAEHPKSKAAKKLKIAAAPEVKPAVALSPAEPVKTEGSKPAPPEEKKWAMSGKRDPFFSPVVQQAGGSGCSTGKKCLEIGHINVRGVVKSDVGFIAVVTNDLNKAYFLRENDPVFNGYVVRITGDSVVFQETVQDKLGKPFTREVTKKIFTPAV